MNERRKDKRMTDRVECIGGDFCQEVESRSGTPVSVCFQCHKCSTGCPIGPEMDLLPSQVMRLVHLGLDDEVLASRAIWLCASCEACTTRCPMEIDIAAVMDALRILAVERKADAARQARQAVQPLVPGQRAAARPGLRGWHDGRLQASQRRPDAATWTRCRKMLAKGKLSLLPHRSGSGGRGAADLPPG